LIPLYAAKDFPDIDLDREQNVVSLCSNCHNWLHYGDDIDVILRPLYEKRKTLLKAIGADITYEQLKSYYN
jgi:Zn-finger protein